MRNLRFFGENHKNLLTFTIKIAVVFCGWIKPYLIHCVPEKSLRLITKGSHSSLYFRTIFRQAP